MSRNSDVYGLPTFRAIMPAGSVALIGPFPGQLAVSIKLITGGTMEIGGASMATIGGAYGLTATSGTIVFQQSQQVGTMYPLASNEVFSGNVSGSFYLYASGATCVVAVAVGRSMGFES